jgi:hypothetical protein
MDQDPRLIPDAQGKQDPATADPRSVPSTLNALVARSHYTLVFWNQLLSQLPKIEALTKTHAKIFPDSLYPEDLKFLELRKAYQVFLIILDNLKTTILTQVQSYVSSAELRQYFERSPSADPRKPDQINARVSLRQDAGRKQICDLLQAIFKDLNLGISGDFPDIRFRLDLMATYLRKNVQAWQWLSPTIRQALAMLSVLAECSLAFELQLSYKHLRIHTESIALRDDPHYFDGI